MICLDDIWKSSDGRPVLQGLTLHIDEGEAVLLTGPSGAGKTTLLRLIYLGDQPERGTLSVAGRQLSKLRPSSVPYVRRNIGVVLQDGKLMADRTVLENVAVAAEVLGLPRSEVMARARSVVEAVGLSAEADRRVRHLPGGLQQRVAMARALCSDPPILLCDEPTGSLDPLAQRGILELLQAMHQRGTTLLVATHDPSVAAFGMAHGWRRAVLHEGRIVSGALPARELLAEGAGLPAALPGAPPERAVLPAPDAPDAEEVTIEIVDSAVVAQGSESSGPVPTATILERSIEVSIKIEVGEEIYEPDPDGQERHP